MARVGYATLVIIPSARGIGSAIQQQAGGDVDKAGRHLGGRLGNTFATAATLGGAAIVGLGAAAVAVGIKTAAANQQAQISFTSLLGSATKAGDFLKGLKQFAAATPFDLPGVEKAAQQLLGVGIQAQQVTPFLTAFGDTAGALGLQTQQFNAVMTQTTQAIANGKFQIGDLSALASNGIPVYKLLGEAFGKTSAQISTMATKGQLTADKVLPALQKQMEKDYGGAMAKQSQTLTGVWSTMQDTFSQGMADVLQPLVPLLAAALPKAAAVLGAVLPVVGKGLAGLVTGAVDLGRRLAPAFRFAVDAVKVFLGAFTGGGWSTGVGKATVPIVAFGQRARATFDSLLATARAVWPKIRAGVVDAFHTLEPIVLRVFAAISSAIPTVVTAVQAVVPYVKDMVSIFQNGVLPAVQPVIAAITAGFTALQPVIRGVFDAFRVARPWIEALGAAYLGLMGAAYAVRGAMIVARVAQLAWLVVTNLGTIATVGWTVAQAALNAVFAANPVGLVIVAVAALVAGLVVAYHQSETFRNIVNAVWTVLRTVVVVSAEAIKNAVVAAWNWIRTATSAVWGAIRTVVVGYLSLVVAGIRLYVGLYVAAFRVAWSAISAVVSGAIAAVRGSIGLLSSIGSTIAGYFESARKGVSDKLAAVVSLLSGLGSRITGAISGLGSLLYGAGKSIVQGLIDGITSMAGSITSAISNTITSHIPGFVKKAMGISSPSKVMAGLGRNIGEGLAVGISGSRDVVTSALTGLVGLTPSASSALPVQRGAAGATAPAGPVATFTGDIYTTDPDEAVRKITTRMRDAVAVGNLRAAVAV